MIQSFVPESELEGARCNMSILEGMMLMQVLEYGKYNARTTALCSGSPTYWESELQCVQDEFKPEFVASLASRRPR